MSENKQAGAFDMLLEELDTLAKALPAEDGKDDEKIQAAAVDGGGEGKDEGAGGDGDADDKGGAGDGDADDKQMTKSFVVKLADGTEIEAEDGTELVKSMLQRLDGNEASMAKAMGAAVDLIKKQGDLLKSLHAKVEKLSNEGKGRKTVVSVIEKPTELAKSHNQEGITAAEFMAKSNAAFASGKISGQDLTVIDVSLRSNVPIDPMLIAKVSS